MFAGKTDVSLENPGEREFAEQDPKRFLQRHPEGAILDDGATLPGAATTWGTKSI